VEVESICAFRCGRPGCNTWGLLGSPLRPGRTLFPLTRQAPKLGVGMPENQPRGKSPVSGLGRAPRRPRGRGSAALRRDAHSRRVNARPGDQPRAILHGVPPLCWQHDARPRETPKRNRRRLRFRQSHSKPQSTYPRRRHHRQAPRCPVGHFNWPAFQAAACSADRPPPGDARWHDLASEADPAEVNFLPAAYPRQYDAIRTFGTVPHSRYKPLATHCRCKQIWRRATARLILPNGGLP